jgi:hypothetical protein
MSLLGDSTTKMTSEQFHQLWVAFLKFVFVEGEMHQHMDPLWNCIANLAKSSTATASINKFLNVVLYKEIQEAFKLTLNLELFITKKNILNQFRDQFPKGKSKLIATSSSTCYFVVGLFDPGDNPELYAITRIRHGFIMDSTLFNMDST